MLRTYRFAVYSMPNNRIIYRFQSNAYPATQEISGPIPRYYSPSVVEVVDPLLCVLLALELDVDVAHQMVSQVVAHIHLLNLEINSVSVRVYYRESEILAE